MLKNGGGGLRKQGTPKIPRILILGIVPGVSLTLSTRAGLPATVLDLQLPGWTSPLGLPLEGNFCNP